MSKWKKRGIDEHTLTVGLLRAVVRPADHHTGFEWLIVGTMVERWLTSPSQPMPLGAAMLTAEQALREMRDALVAHFAPVLRWEQTPGGWTARLGCWILFARQNRWTIRQEYHADWCRDVCESPSAADGYRADEEQARRDAERALRSLDVTFRTEGDR